MLSAAKTSGNGSLLWPVGCTSIEEVANDLVMAIQHGYRVLSWFEHLPEDERPPRWMWHLEHELDSWFDQVDQRRKAKYGGSSDDDGPMGEMMSNELAAGIRGG